MNLFLVIEGWLQLALMLVLLVLEVWALVQALRFRPDAYVAAGRRTKGFWCAMTAGAVALGALSLLGYLGVLIGLVAIVMAGVFLADVLPALRVVMGNAQGRYGRRPRRA